MSKHESPRTYSQLKANGPMASSELSSDVQYADRKRGVVNFKPTTTQSGALSLPAGQVGVYYIQDVHEPVDVVEEWLEQNPQIRENNTDNVLHRALCKRGSDWKDASKELFNPDFRATSSSGSQHGGGTCPLCGDDYNRYLSDHLPCGGSDE